MELPNRRYATESRTTIRKLSGKPIRRAHSRGVRRRKDIPKQRMMDGREFDNLRRFFPKLTSMRDFIASDDYPGGLEITFQGNVYGLEGDRAEKLAAVQGLPGVIGTEIRANLTDSAMAENIGQKMSEQKCNSILHFPFSIFHFPFSIFHFPFSIFHFPFSMEGGREY